MAHANRKWDMAFDRDHNWASTRTPAKRESRRIKRKNEEKARNEKKLARPSTLVFATRERCGRQKANRMNRVVVPLFTGTRGGPSTIRPRACNETARRRPRRGRQGTEAAVREERRCDVSRLQSGALSRVFPGACGKPPSASGQVAATQSPPDVHSDGSQSATQRDSPRVTSTHPPHRCPHDAETLGQRKLSFNRNVIGRNLMLGREKRFT